MRGGDGAEEAGYKEKIKEKTEMMKNLKLKLLLCSSGIFFTVVLNQPKDQS